MIQTAIFILLALLTIVPALFVVTLKNVFHSALFLILSMLGVAGLYAMLAADFLFAVQLLVYAGGIMVILLFVVLLSGKPSDWAEKQVNEKALGAGLFSVFLVVVVATTLFKWAVKEVVVEPQATSGPLGVMLLGPMLLPFEIISLVLVAALVGAIYFSKRKSL
jgi:NADH:ubiquinone oxidoreductase subunit 6 (subunit J)